MENRPAPLRSRRVCRFCLSDSEPLSFIYERDHNKPFQVPLALQIMSCVAIEVSGPAANDTLGPRRAVGVASTAGGAPTRPPPSAPRG